MSGATITPLRLVQHEDDQQARTIEHAWADERASLAEAALENERRTGARILEALAAAGSPAPQPQTEAHTYATDALIADYMRSRQTRGRSKATIKFYEGLAKPLRRLLPALAKDITHRALLEYIEKRYAEGAKERVRKELHSFLRPALRLARKSKLFADDPRDVIPDLDSNAQPRKRAPTAEEVWRIVRGLADRSKAGRDHAACYAWAAATGAEYAAWSRAKPADIREDNRGCQVHGTKNAHRERFAPTLLPTQQELLRYAREHAAGTDGALFRPWSTTNANTDLREVCTALGIEPTSTHDVRRAYTQWLTDAGVRDSLVDAALGHAPASVLSKHYAGEVTPDRLLKLFEDDLRARAPQLPAEPRTEPNQPTDNGVGPMGLEPMTYGLKVSASKTVEESLIYALSEATRAGQWETVTALAKAIAALAGMVLVMALAGCGGAVESPPPDPSPDVASPAGCIAGGRTYSCGDVADITWISADGTLGYCNRAGANGPCPAGAQCFVSPDACGPSPTPCFAGEASPDLFGVCH